MIELGIKRSDFGKYRIGLADVQAISKNTGLTIDEITRLKNHFFLEKHIFQKQGGFLSKFLHFDGDDDITRIWLYTQKSDITRYDYFIYTVNGAETNCASSDSKTITVSK